MIYYSASSIMISSSRSTSLTVHDPVQHFLTGFSTTTPQSLQGLHGLHRCKQLFQQHPGSNSIMESAMNALAIQLFFIVCPCTIVHLPE